MTLTLFLTAIIIGLAIIIGFIFMALESCLKTLDDMMQDLEELKRLMQKNKINFRYGLTSYDSDELNNLYINKVSKIMKRLGGGKFESKK